MKGAQKFYLQPFPIFLSLTFWEILKSAVNFWGNVKFSHDFFTYHKSFAKFFKASQNLLKSARRIPENFYFSKILFPCSFYIFSKFPNFLCKILQTVHSKNFQNNASKIFTDFNLAKMLKIFFFEVPQNFFPT